MNNYVTVFANSQHNSRVATPTFLPRSLDRIADFTGKVKRDKTPPSAFVLVSPEAKHVAVLVAAGMPEPVYYTGQGASEAFDRRESRGPFGYRFDAEGFWDGDRFRSWQTGREASLGKPHEREDWVNAVWTNGETWVQISEVFSSEQRRPGTNLFRFTRTASLTSGWIREMRPAAACLTELGGAVILTSQGRLVAYEPDLGASDFLTGALEKPPVVNKKLSDASGGVAYTMSLLNGGLAVVFIDPTTRPDYSLVVDPWGMKDKWSSYVLMMDPTGKDLWRTEISWAIRQPPIDGGNGRVVVAGDGLAAIVDGVVQWRIDGGPVRATAFGDGALAIAKGSFLKIIDRDGKELASYETPDHEELVSPPAIASDRSIWVASANHLYVAR